MQLIEHLNFKTNIHDMTKSEVLYDLTKTCIMSDKTLSTVTASDKAISIYNLLLKEGIIKEGMRE